MDAFDRSSAFLFGFSIVLFFIVTYLGG